MKPDLERAAEGIGGAWARLAEALRDRRTQDASIALVELLAWLRATHEWLERHTEGLKERSGVEPMYSVLQAVRFARNRGVHALASLNDERRGVGFPLNFPMRFGPTWLDSGPVDPKHPDALGHAAYESTFAGRAFPGRLYEAVDFILREARSAAE
ncbi:MAG: hypothetical protein JWM85_438 [Acidimicrobiaceae bacterium]|nr:hypothetical protein [Acidimicrobiaceae bacterium]